MNRLKAIVTIKGKIECITGLHIGGSGGGYEIGGMDNPVIRNPIDGFPYIPGSSLKGKMRSLMEWAEGKVTTDGTVYFAKSDPNDLISRIFGAPAEADKRSGPTRLIVRDAVVDEKTRKMMIDLEEKQGLPKVEIKTEVSINRLTSKPPSGPRQTERVPVGSAFDFEMSYGVYEVEGLNQDDIDLIDKLFLALRLVEDSALGGSGSRGYGQVKFRVSNTIIKTVEDYIKGTQKDLSTELKDLATFTVSDIDKIKQELKQLP
ncbi:MAG: type III-A CRISPR-associated RAMP protein Csm3 [Blastocatellia bacterium]|nr:type III-A CRISPR-associated RAMP protein Csm3 [Blastocatellia bacterium]